jgi:deoxyribodipyrimidine photo-lyase
MDENPGTGRKLIKAHSQYDSFSCLPAWAQKTLSLHQADQREYGYSLTELEQAGTHDPYWNAAQREMLKTGKMQGYMRMYWGKKILEWSKTP